VTPPDMSLWTGRDDTAAEGPDALRWHQMVKPLAAGAPPGVALIGFCCDEGVRRNGGRVGAAEGPKALRKALANLAWHQRHPVYDAGDVACTDGDLEAAQERLAEAVAGVIRGGHRPLVLGGGHETAWGTFQGLARIHPDALIGIVNIDAHLDMRRSDRGTSGTAFAQMAAYCQQYARPFRYMCMGISALSNTSTMIERAKELGVIFVTDAVVNGAFERLDRFVAGADLVHLSIDLDVLPGSVMPAVSAPAARGLSLELVESLIGVVLDSNKVGAVDLVELNPTFDHDNQSARVAAWLAYQITSEWES
jgi:formiminoglutamase